MRDYGANIGVSLYLQQPVKQPQFWILELRIAAVFKDDSEQPEFVWMIPMRSVFY